MATEARIVINGEVLTGQEAMTVRLAVDALANILGGAERWAAMTGKR